MWDEGLFDIFVSPQWLDSDPFAGGSSEPLLLGLTTRSADGGSLVGPAPSAMREGAKRAVKTINKGGGILGRRVELVSSSSSTNLNELGACRA